MRNPNLKIMVNALLHCDSLLTVKTCLGRAGEAAKSALCACAGADVFDTTASTLG